MSSPITTHVLDTARGRPAAGVAVRLERWFADTWAAVGAGVTDADGRLLTLVPEGRPIGAGRYRLTFDTAAYFRATGVPGFYPEVPVVFEITDPSQHYHVPLLLSPHGYSTYRGS
jgi:5-hydroxyisourate hydrolase